MLTALEKKKTNQTKNIGYVHTRLSGKRDKMLDVSSECFVWHFLLAVFLFFDLGLDFTLKTIKMVKNRVKESANDFAKQVCFLAFLYSSAPLNTKKSMCIFLYGNKLCLQKKNQQTSKFYFQHD